MNPIMKRREVFGESHERRGAHYLQPCVAVLSLACLSWYGISHTFGETHSKPVQASTIGNWSISIARAVHGPGYKS